MRTCIDCVAAVKRLPQIEVRDKGGDLALQEISRKKPILANRTAPEIEARIVEFSLEQPAFGQIRRRQ